MRVGITGATGLIGTRLVSALKQRGDSVVALSRDPERARQTLGTDAVGWDPSSGPAPEQTLSELDGVVNLAGEPVAQRWTAGAKELIRSSRVLGTQHLVEGLQAAWPRPRVLVSISAAGYYGDRGSELLDESAPPGNDFLASVCVEWESVANRAAELGVRVVIARLGVVLDRHGGALQKMLPAFKSFVGGPVAGGRQYMPWINLNDVVGILTAALEGTGAATGGPSLWSGPVNACAPSPATNAEFSHALGQALHRPSAIPVPGFALRRMFGEMSTALTASQRMVPARTLELGYEFRYPGLEEGLRAALT